MSSELKPMRKAVFLDRDGVINHDLGYVYKWNKFRIFDDLVPFLRKIERNNLLPIIITNQSGISRGFYTVKDLKVLMETFDQYLVSNGLSPIRYYFCPHHPNLETSCNCRKPNTGLLFQAKRDYNILLNEFILIGDKLTDIECGRRGKLKTTFLINRSNELKSEFSDGFVNVINSLAEVNLGRIWCD